jgi:hypothetical protein
MRGLHLLASRVAAAVARDGATAGSGGGSTTSWCRRTAASSSSASAAAATPTPTPAASTTAPPPPPPPPTVAARGLDDASPQRAESVALLRLLNVAALPELRGQAVLARVVRASRHELLLDPGYYSLCSVPRAGVMPAAAPEAAPASSSAGGAGRADSAAANNANNTNNNNASQVRVGDYVRVRLAELFTPYGDPQLEPVRTSRAARDKLVWRELERRMRQGQAVGGRVLNACNGGYAVGVGGYVALLRTEQAPAEVVRAVGTLQPFYVHKMSGGRRDGGRQGGRDEAGGRGGGRRRGGGGRGGGADDRPLIELTCTSQRADGDGGGGGGLYSNV